MTVSDLKDFHSLFIWGEINLELASKLPLRKNITQERGQETHSSCQGTFPGTVGGTRSFPTGEPQGGVPARDQGRLAERAPREPQRTKAKLADRALSPGPPTASAQTAGTWNVPEL